jgi:hypothetical protein
MMRRLNDLDVAAAAAATASSEEEADLPHKLPEDVDEAYTDLLGCGFCSKFRD